MNSTETYTAFADQQILIQGGLKKVATLVKELLDQGDRRSVLVFADKNGHQMDLDLRGDLAQVLAWIEAMTKGSSAEKKQPEQSAKRSPGRPRLGVVGREVTLLPRHWQWLNAQPGGASVALRKLVEQARSENAERDRARRSRENAFGFMNAMAGNEEGFEEASRALFAGKQAAFTTEIRNWPTDIRGYVAQLALDAWDAG